jgi:hypothetical protein
MMPKMDQPMGAEALALGGASAFKSDLISSDPDPAAGSAPLGADAIMSVPPAPQEPAEEPAPAPAAVHQPDVPPVKRIELHEVEPLSIDGPRITVDVKGRGPSALGLDKIQAVSTAVIRAPGEPAYILIDLLLDPPWATSARLRVVRMRSGKMDPAKVIPDAPNSAAALRTMIDRILAASQGIPLPDARAVKGNPFRDFPSLKQYERDILQAG